MNISGVLISSTVVVLLVGCASAPTGPSVLSLPGTGKSFGDFRLDDAQCRQYAAQQTSGLPSDPGVRNALIGTAVGALAGAAINGSQGAGIGAGAGLVVGSVSGAGEARGATYSSQHQYDNAYIQCMYASGNKVPVPAAMVNSQSRVPVAPSPGRYYPPPPPDYYPPPAR